MNERDNLLKAKDIAEKSASLDSKITDAIENTPGLAECLIATMVSTVEAMINEVVNRGPFEVDKAMLQILGAYTRVALAQYAYATKPPIVLEEFPVLVGFDDLDTEDWNYIHGN